MVGEPGLGEHAVGEARRRELRIAFGQCLQRAFEFGEVVHGSILSAVSSVRSAASARWTATRAAPGVVPMAAATSS